MCVGTHSTYVGISSNNLIDVAQQGMANSTAICQFGDGHQAMVAQQGVGNRASVVQGF